MIKTLAAALLLAASATAAHVSADLAARQGVDPSTTQWYIDMILLHHNVHRANHSVANLTWDQGLADAASQTASTCYFAHNESAPYQGQGNNYGQNIQAGTDAYHPGDIITGSFYNPEEPNYAGYYGQPNPPDSVFDSVGHFTQVVWNSTYAVGCYTQDCTATGVGPSGGYGYFTVCDYYPPGNYGGEFGDNVFPPLGYPSVYGDYTGTLGPDPDQDPNGN